MEPIDWKRKLSSRKFWVAVCSFVTNMILALGGTEEVALKVTGLIMSGATVIAYIVSEGLIDAKNKEPEYVYIDEELPEAEETPNG